jgi:RNA polymerase sigma-70 factor (ECF subfamily)
MEDKDIVAMYWQRNQKAINETRAKYGNYCHSIAMNILLNNEDVEECVNDTYLNAWNSMPPHRPNILSVFIGKITRHLSFDKLRYKTADKRGGGEIHLVLDELAEIVSGNESADDVLYRKELIKEINEFLNTLSKKNFNIFVCRYWYACPVSHIAKQFRMTENNVSVTLNRIRSSLKAFLTERGYDL